MAEPLPQASFVRRSPVAAEIEGTRLVVIDSGEERLRVLLELIEGARESLRLLFYIFAGDEAGRAVRDALAAAAARGVKVEVLLDGFGCSNIPSDFFGDLQAQARFCVFHPRYGRRYLIRNHQKLVVADGKRALIGGANVEKTYLTDEGPTHWRDLWLLIDGPAAAPAARYFDDVFRWTTGKGAKLRNLRRLIFRHSRSEGPLQWKFSAPLSRRNPWPAAFARDLSGARRVEIIAAYFTPPRSILRRIARAARRGTVRIITAGKSDNNATVAAARHAYSRLLRRKVEMYEYQAARLHTKLMIVDDAVYIGSANLDFRSIYLNLEIVLRIEEPAFAAAMRGYFERELEGSERITPEVHKRRASPWRRLQWWLSHWLVTSMDYTVTRRLNWGE